MRNDGGLLEKVRALERAIWSMKNAQGIGSDSIKGYAVSSKNINDYSVSVAQNQVKSFRVRFNFSTVKKKAIVRMRNFYSIDNQDVMSVFVEPSPVGGAVGVRTEKQLPQDGYQDWIISVSNYGFSATSFTVYLKFFFNGNADGSFTVTAI